MACEFKWKTLFGVILIFVFIAIRMVSPKISGAITDEVIGKLDLNLLPKMMAILAGLSIISSGCIYLRGYLLETVSMGVIYNVRQRCFEHLHELPFRFYDKHRIGEIMSRLTGDVEAIRNFLAGGMVNIIQESFFYFGSLIMIATISLPLALILFVFTPLLAVFGWRFDKRIRPAFDANREQSAVLNTLTQEVISGIRVVKAYAREPYEKGRFRKENNKHMEAGITISNIVADYHPIIDMLAGSVPMILSLVGGYLACMGKISPGDVVACFSYLWMVTDPMRQFANIINQISFCESSCERVFYYIDIGSELKDVPNPRYPKEFQGHVQFDHVNFTYGDEPVLEDISFDVPAGHTLAIMGATGSGKTSIVNLIGRFYECQKGRVLVDGIDVKEYAMKRLRKNIGYVMQETFLFSESLAENIGFGLDDPTVEDLDRASRVSQAYEFIDTLEDRYETIVGERGMGLSGGQKQRVSIARAIIVDPKILILDAATSAVDLETESAIQAGLKDVLQGRTTFIISHRISAVKDADEIIVLDKGRIAERGTHDTLMAKKGLYYGIFLDQFRDYQSIMGKEAEALA